MTQHKTFRTLTNEAYGYGKSHEHYIGGMISVVKMQKRSPGVDRLTFWLNGNHSITRKKASQIVHEHFHLTQQAQKAQQEQQIPLVAQTTSMEHNMQLVTFSFHPQRESDERAAIDLARKHFPGAFLLTGSESAMRYRGVNIKCTGAQFLAWMVERCNAGFVNRMKQLDIKLENVNVSQITTTYHGTPVKHAVPFEYATPEVEGLR